jgi:hypothetical protein
MLICDSVSSNTLDFTKAAESATHLDSSSSIKTRSNTYCPESCEQYNDAFYEESKKNIEWVFSQRQKGYEWNHFSTIVIFWVVIIIVMTGVILSIMEFQKDLNAAEPTALKFSFKDGIEITSSVIGILLLTFSLVFFYLYLKQVYPIVEAENVEAQVEKSE